MVTILLANMQEYTEDKALAQLAGVWVCGPLCIPHLTQLPSFPKGLRVHFSIGCGRAGSKVTWDFAKKKESWIFQLLCEAGSRMTLPSPFQRVETLLIPLHTPAPAPPHPPRPHSQVDPVWHSQSTLS